MNSILIKFSSKEPIYQQLYKALLEEIFAMRISAGDKLPAKRPLASQLGISVNTVDTAYQMLVAEGYVNAKAKSGFYVNKIPNMPSVKELNPPPIPVQKKKWLYNFETSSIDTSLFPFKLWCRIEREVLGDLSLLNHGDKQGDYNLRNAIAGYLHEFRGVEANAENIIVGAGIEYLLCILARLFLNSLIAIEEPGYEKANRVLQAFGAKTVYVPVDDSGMSCKALTQSGATAAYITPSCQFPMGITMPAARRRELLHWASEGEQRYLIEDDYNSEFRFSSRPVPALQGLDKAGKVVYVGTFSKSVAPSIRVAYMVLPTQLMAKYKDEYGFFSSTVSRFDQQALYQFISKGHFARHLNRLRVACRKRRDTLVKQLKLQLGSLVKVSTAQTGLHLIAQISCGKSESQLIELARGVGINLTGLGEYFHTNTPPTTASVVLGYSALSETQIIQAVALLKQAWI